MKEKQARPQGNARRKPQDKLSLRVNFLNDVENLLGKYKGKDDELDGVLQNLLSKTGSIVEREVEKEDIPPL